MYVFCFLVAVTEYLVAGEEDKMEGNAENVYTVWLYSKLILINQEVSCPTKNK